MREPMRAAAIGIAFFACGCGDDASDTTGTGQQQGTLIKLGDGTVRGDVDGGTRRFRGIPFAAPPVGALRYKPPAPVAAWSGTRDALDWGGRCAQLGSLQAQASENEDCLYLNVW